MCVIFHLDPGAMPNKEKFFNSVYNNWHSWGIVIKTYDGKISMVKGVPQSGENDPEQLYKLLEDNKGSERALHIRHTTRGATDYQNAQPFEIMKSEDANTFFMHNGTLHSFGSSSTTENAVSDTRDFCEKILIPSINCWHGPLGRGDYTDPNYQKLVVDKQWVNSSTGLFVSDKYPMLTIGSGWSPMADSEGDGQVLVSNKLYFDRISRGPEYDRREAARKEKEKAEQKSFRYEGEDFGYGDDGWGDFANGHYRNHHRNPSSNSSNSNVVTVKDWKMTSIVKSEDILRGLDSLQKNEKFNDFENTHNLAYITYDEWVAFVNETSEFEAAWLIEKLVEHNFQMHTQLEKEIITNERYRKVLGDVYKNRKENEHVAAVG